ncbi:MAG: TrbI/VirB10 family protein [Terriglobales bacterium]
MRFNWKASCAVVAVAMLPVWLSQQTFAQPNGSPSAQQTASSSNPQTNATRLAGYNAGFRDGVTDYRNHAPYDFQSHPTYKQADQGYNQASGVNQQTYAMDFRSGYEAGYDDGFYGRNNDQGAQRQRNYTPPASNPSARNQSQSPQPNYEPSRPTNADANGALPAGTALYLKLNNTLSSRSSHQGDNFTATVTAPVYSQSGQQVLVPAGSTVEGTVASVRSSGGVSGESQLQLNFQRLRLPDGSSLPLRAEVSQVSPQQGVGSVITGTPSATNEGGVQQSQTRNTVGTAAAGGAVGALIGAIAGGGKGAGIGGLVGAGLGVVLASRNGALDLPAGTPIVIRLSSPINLRG